MRTRTVKRASRHIIERFYARLTLDFDTNKRVCDEIAVIQSKRLRNKIAGFTTVRGARVGDGGRPSRRSSDWRSGGVGNSVPARARLSGVLTTATAPPPPSRSQP